MLKHIIIVLLLSPLFLVAQIGGNHVYEFLSVPTSARSAALGGSAIAINDGDITLANENPALFSSATSGKFAIEYINYFSDVNFGQTSYSYNFKDIGTVGFGIQFMDGGNFIETNVDGDKIGTFSMSEFAFKLSYAKSFDSIFSIGATVKPVYSSLYTNKSFGILMDMGATYTSRNKLFVASLVFKNFGSQITTYTDNYEPVPFEIKAGISTKLEHAPFRFSIIAQHLETARLSSTKTNYPEPTNVEIIREEQKQSEILDEVLRHMIFGIEFVPTKNFFIRGGLNYNRRQELKLTDRPGAVGFSWGFGFRIAKLHFSYANARYHFSSASNHFTITTNLSDFF